MSCALLCPSRLYRIDFLSLMKRKARSQVIELSLSDLEDSAPQSASITIERFSTDRRRILQVQQENIRFSSSSLPSVPATEVIHHDLSQLESYPSEDAREKSKKRHGGRVLLSVRVTHLCPGK